MSTAELRVKLFASWESIKGDFDRLKHDDQEHLVGRLRAVAQQIHQLANPPFPEDL